jgi:CheY-like chemotaxis protein
MAASEAGSGTVRVETITELLASAMLFLPEPVLLTATQSGMTKVVFANEYFQQLTGYSMQEIENPFAPSQEQEEVRRRSSEIIHDFNSLLTAILVYSGLLTSRVQNDRQLQRYAEEITAAAERGCQLVAQLRNLERQETAEARVVEVGGSEKIERNKPTLLLVEDEELVRQSVDAALSMRGYKILPAANAEEAMRISQNYSGEIELMVTDLGLPVTNGVELAQEIHAVRPGMKVLFVSGSGDDPRMNELADGRESFFKKPFTPAALAHKIEELLNKHSDE